MNLWEKLFGKSGEAITKTIAETVDGLSTSDDEKAIAKEKLTNTVMTHLVTALQAQKDVIISESQGNWMQRSWRPILMLSFGFIIIYRYFLSQLFSLPAVDLPDGFWELLYFGMGGYVVSRSVEKVADTVVKNVDISFVKKKNREV
jgi:hypothetical protein